MVRFRIAQKNVLRHVKNELNDVNSAWTAGLRPLCQQAAPNIEPSDEVGPGSRWLNPGPPTVKQQLQIPQI